MDGYKGGDSSKDCCEEGETILEYYNLAVP